MTFYGFIAEALFYAFSLLVFLGAILAVRVKRLMHAIMGLAVCFCGVAGLYYYLGSVFLSMMQILIYVGAICVLMALGIMVGYTPKEMAAARFTGRRRFFASIASLSGFFLVLIPLLCVNFSPMYVTERVGDFSMNWLGHTLLHDFCLAFELISVVLLAAIIGAIILATDERDMDPCWL